MTIAIGIERFRVMKKGYCYKVRFEVYAVASNIFGCIFCTAKHDMCAWCTSKAIDDIKKLQKQRLFKIKTIRVNRYPPIESFVPGYIIIIIQ